ncbi:hypothetical protein JOM56_003350 [Amanita muscaria]
MMFEDVCLVCGRHLADDGRAYCSGNCENADISSPSLSSASSALSSPHIGHTVGGEVPPLLPSALGVALKKHRNSDRHSVSSSSASSASWSISTKDEGEEPVLGINTDYYQTDGIEHICEVNAVNMPPTWSAGLSYTRLPSGTNNRSTVSNIQKQTGSISPAHVCGTPRSVPNYSHPSAEEEEAQPQLDFGFSSWDSANGYEISRYPFPDNGPTTIKSKHPRNRASLPAYFSLLQLSNPGQKPRSSPISSSSNRTIVRRATPSPPTPKLALSTGPVRPHTPASQSTHGDNTQETPRGRRRVPGSSRSSRQSGSHSKDRSRIHYDVPCTGMLIDLTSQRPEIRDAVRHTLNWASDPCTSRTRNTIKKSGTTPPKNPCGKLDGYINTRRGRLRMEELDDFSPEAPGYGHGRSGLVDRQRAIGTRTTYY